MVLALENSLLVFWMSNGNLFDVGDIFIVALPKNGLLGTERYELWGMLQERVCKRDTSLWASVYRTATKYLG